MENASFRSLDYVVTTELTVLEQVIPVDRRRNLTIFTHADTAGDLRVYYLDPDDNVRLDVDLGTTGVIGITANTLDIQKINHSYPIVRVTFDPGAQPGTVEVEMMQSG